MAASTLNTPHCTPMIFQGLRFTVHLTDAVELAHCALYIANARTLAGPELIVVCNGIIHARLPC